MCTLRVNWRGNSCFDVSDERLVLITMPNVHTVIKRAYGPLSNAQAIPVCELQCAIVMAFVLSELNVIQVQVCGLAVTKISSH